jgi:hypothetical protein
VSRLAPGWQVVTGGSCRARLGWRHEDRKRRAVTCPEDAVAALNRPYRRRDGMWVDCLWRYCPAHMYGKWIEGGEVLGWRLEKSAAS